MVSIESNNMSWVMGDCLKACEHHIKYEENGDTKFTIYVTQLLAPDQIGQTSCIPVAKFVEKDRAGLTISNHCFLRNNETRKIYDPMYDKEMQVDEYIKFLNTKVQLEKTQQYLTMEIQQLPAKNRKESHGRFEPSYGCMAITYDRSNDEVVLE